MLICILKRKHLQPKQTRAAATGAGSRVGGRKAALRVALASNLSLPQTLFDLEGNLVVHFVVFLGHGAAGYCIY